MGVGPDAGPARASASADDLSAQLRDAVADPRRVQTRTIDRVAFAGDASVYQRIPRAVVHAVDVDEVRRIVAIGHAYGVPVTFRAAGTSLSGQAITDGVLVVLARGWKRIEAIDGGDRVRVEPGVIGADVNRYLTPFGRRIGPDPASIDSCMMGGILANNASGMCCGVVENAYHTIEAAKILLADGTFVDTAAPDAAARLARDAPHVVSGLRALRADLLADPELVATIRAKYRQKNTTGYSLNALIDFEEPIDILPRLLVGSEGTLGFLAEATLRTLPVEPVRSTSFMLFASTAKAADAARVLAASGARAVEIFDRASLRAVDDLARELLGADVDFTDDAAALLVEYREATVAALDARRPAIEAALRAIDLVRPAAFTDDATRQARIWHARKGLYPAVGAVRARGTSVIVEDVAVPVERLGACVEGLQELFARHGYDDAIVFGHAKDGNLHFVLSQGFDDEAAVRRYGAFMDDLVDLVARRLGGALKAEHGTGRNIAPFVEVEWGPRALAIMRRLKAIFDPHRVLNPGVILNDDPHCHLKDLKKLPAVAPEIDACVECGFCEKVCPSAELTLTPRGRIAVLRHVARTGDDDVLVDFSYDGLDTCAADGSCATACPVGIDTGRLVKRRRDEAQSPTRRRFASWIARSPARAEMLVRTGLRASHGAESVFGPDFVRGVLGFVRGATGWKLPDWVDAQPCAPRATPFDAQRPDAPEAILFPTCMSRIMGRPRGAEDAQFDLLRTLCERAGVAAWTPRALDGGCCGLALASKGHAAPGRHLLADLVRRLHALADGGAIPIVVDASSCTHHLLEDGDALDEADRAAWAALDLRDVTTFVRDTLLPRLQIVRTSERVFVHPNCASRRMGTDAALVDCVRAVSGDVVVPDRLACCGTAGDRGLAFPELPAAALRYESEDLDAAAPDRAVGSNLTCETGLTATTGRVFESFLVLLEEATRPAPPPTDPN